MAGVTFKVIYPTGFGAIGDEIYNLVLKETEASAESALKQFEKTTRTWKHRVKFVRYTSIGGFVVGTNDEIYNFVNNGTKPHVINASRAPFLVFNRRFTPKTRVGVVGSRKGSRGGGWVRKKQVMHPGSEGRKFDETIAARLQPKLEKRIERGIAKIAKKRGVS